MDGVGWLKYDGAGGNIEAEGVVDGPKKRGG